MISFDFICLFGLKQNEQIIVYSCWVQVDDKYQYSCENTDNSVHGWVSTLDSVGFWMITPSNEFRNGGPIKQDLTSHVGPFTLNVCPKILSKSTNRTLIVPNFNVKEFSLSIFCLLSLNDYRKSLS